MTACISALLLVLLLLCLQGYPSIPMALRKHHAQHAGHADTRAHRSYGVAPVSLYTPQGPSELRSQPRVVA